MAKMKLAVYTVMIGPSNVEAAADMVANAGYDGIEWRIHPEWHISPADLPRHAKQYAQLAEERGIATSGFSTYIPISDLKTLDAVFAGAAEMEAMEVRVNVPRYDGKKPYPRLLDEAKRDLKGVADLAKRHGIKATVEMHHGGIIIDSAYSMRLVEGFDPAQIGVIYDPGNMVHEGFERWQMGMELLGDYLARVHVKNAKWVSGPKDSQGMGRWKAEWAPLDDGVVHWGDVINALKAVGYEGWLSLEDFHSGMPVDRRLKSAQELLTRLIKD